MAGPSGPAYMRKDGYFMKAMKRRLLSLFMAMVMVCSLVPVALAANEYVVPISGDTTASSITGTVTLTASAKEGETPVSDVTYAWTVPSTLQATSSTNAASITLKAADQSATASVTGLVSCTVTSKDANASKDGSSSATVTFTYVAPTPTVDRVSLSPSSLDFTVGTTTAQTVTATVEGTGLAADDKKVTWSLGENNYVELAEQADTTTKVQLKTGATAPTTDQTVTLTATSTKDTSKSGTCTIKIKAAEVPAATISLGSLSASTIYYGGGTTSATGTLTATNFSNYTIRWNISPANAVTITPAAGTAASASTAYTITAGNVSSSTNVTISASLMNGQTVVATSSNITITVAPYNEFTLSASSPSNAKTIYLNNWTGSYAYEYLDFTVVPTWKQGGTVVSTSPTVSYQWKLNNINMTNSDAASFRLYSNTTGLEYGNEKNTVKCIATFKVGNTEVGSKEVTWDVRTGYESTSLNPSVTVYDGNSGYSLADDPDEGSKSMATLIDEWVERNYKAIKYTGYEIEFEQVGDSSGKTGYLNASKKTPYTYDTLSDVIFEPTPFTGTTKSASASYNFTLYVYTSGSNRYYDACPGTMTFNIKEGGDSSGDITYTASLGEDVPFSVSDFEDFYASKYSRGYLKYVTFGSSSTNGTLYNEDGKSAGSTPYYVSPSSRQKALDSIYFSPKSSMKKSTTVKISFTAYGTNRSDSGEGEVSGTVSIVYLNDSAKDITYNTTGGKVTLNPQDFEEAYKEATGSKTAPSNLTIEFQDVPSNGTLTYTGGTRDKDLTRSNVKSTRYTTKSSGSNRLAQLTYSGTKGKDTISYIAYSGSTAQFTGKVVFNGAAAVPTDVVVTYGSTGGQAVAFSQNDFVRANSVMSNAVKVRFTAPANGTLQMSGANAAGIDIAASLLGSVSYKPRAGFNGTDKIIFAAYDASNAVVASGSVNVTVVGNPSTGTSGGTNPGGVTDVSQFKDVSSTAWYRNDLATLVSQGIITGKGEGKFDPLGTVTYGEALKMILEACGYTATLGTGSNWAINYKNLAVSNGWISSSIDLNAAISRNATAELAARVMGVAPATSGSPFADEANAYAVALYYTNPQIFVGDNTTGKLLFKNGSPLLRQEVCAVICRVRNYHTQHTTNTMPDGI